MRIICNDCKRYTVSFHHKFVCMPQPYFGRVLLDTMAMVQIAIKEQQEIILNDRDNFGA